MDFVSCYVEGATSVEIPILLICFPTSTAALNSSRCYVTDVHGRTQLSEAL